MNLKKDKKLQGQEVWDHFQTLLLTWTQSHPLCYISLFPAFLFCPRALQCKIQAAVQLYSTYSSNTPPWAGAITCLSNSISRSPYLPAPSIFLPCCHHVRSYKAKLLRESRNSSYQIITLPLCAADQIHPNLLGAPPPLPIPLIPIPFTDKLPSGKELRDPRDVLLCRRWSLVSQL